MSLRVDILRKESLEDNLKTYEFRPVRTKEELLDLLRLRYNTWTNEQYLLNERNSIHTRLEVDEYDSYSIPIGGFQKIEGHEELVTTGRIITQVKQDFYDSLFSKVLNDYGDDILWKSYTKQRRQPLIIFEEYLSQIESLLSDYSIDGNYVEYSRVMNDSKCRGGKILIKTGQVLHAYSKYFLGAKIAFLICPQDHLNMHIRLNKIAGQIPATGIVEHSRVGGNKSIGLYVDLEKFNNNIDYSLEVDNIYFQLKNTGHVTFKI